MVMALALIGIVNLVTVRWPISRRAIGPRGHDLWLVENDKDFWLLSASVDAIGILDQTGSDRTAGGGFGTPRPRLRASALSLNAMRYLCES